MQLDSKLSTTILPYPLTTASDSRRFDVASNKLYRACPGCGHNFGGQPWHGSSWCIALYALRLIEAEPGLSASELAQLAQLPAHTLVKPLQRLRTAGVVQTEQEERADVGWRYRHWPNDQSVNRARFVEMVRKAEGQNDSVN